MCCRRERFLNRLNRDGEAAGTTTILLLDRLNTAWTHQFYANQQVIKFLASRRSQDWVGIYTLGLDLKVVQELTGDPDLLRTAAESLKPQDTNHRTLDIPGEFEKRDPELSGRVLEEFTAMTTRERVSGTEQALEAIARHLTQVPGRKNLIWITDSFPLLLVPPARPKSPVGPQGAPASLPEDFSPEMRSAARRLNDANVAIYPVDARGLCLSDCGGGWGFLIPGLDTMNFVAGLTGGQAHYADNGIAELIAESIEDGELTYTLGFYPAQEAQDGMWHNLKVKVNRSGLRARYRENYFAATAQDAANDRPTLDQLLKESLDATQIGLTAQATADAAGAGAFQVQVSVDLHDVQLERQATGWKGTVEVSFHLEGLPTAWKVTRKIEIPTDQLAARLEKGELINTSITPEGPPGILRIVAQDQATGAAGSLRIPLGGK